MDHFYITLPSNSSHQYYGMQNMSNYKTKLAKDINLNVSEWEVGLAEFIYPNSWKNIREGSFKVRKLENNKWIYRNGQVPDKKYENAEDLIDFLTEELDKILGSEQRTKIHMRYHEPTRRVKLHVEEGYALELLQELSQALGFGDNNQCEIHNLSENDITMDEPCNNIVIKRLRELDGDKILATFIVDVNGD